MEFLFYRSENIKTVGKGSPDELEPALSDRLDETFLPFQHSTNWNFFMSSSTVEMDPRSIFS